MWWSYLLGVVGLTGLFLTGNMRKAGFLVGLGAQVLWIAYAVDTEQYGFIPLSLGYAFMYGRNWLRWRNEERAVRDQSLTYVPRVQAAPTEDPSRPRREAE